MINLKGPSTHTRVYESNEIPITESLTTATVIALQHNFGCEPDAIFVYIKNPYTGVWEVPWDYWSNPAGQSLGWYGFNLSATINTAYVGVFYTWGGTITYKFKCVKYNTISRNFEPFKWSNSEQVWPFELNKDGEVLYCKEIDCGALPNNGNKTLDMSISGFNQNKVFRMNMEVVFPGATGTQTGNLPVTFTSNAVNTYDISYQTFANGTLFIEDHYNFSAGNAIFRIIYAK